MVKASLIKSHKKLTWLYNFLRKDSHT